jgi:hypothetical protein
MNIILVLGLFFYLSKVLTLGNGDELVDQLAKEKPFLLWFIALTILNTLRKHTGKLGDGLWLLFILSSILAIAPKLLPLISNLLDNSISYLSKNNDEFKYTQGDKEVNDYSGNILNIEINKDSSSYANGFFNDGHSGVKTPQD